MVDVFISYSRRDLDMVGLIARAIEGEGYEVWWDADLAPHQSYGEVITDKIDMAKAALVVWSADAVASEWVRAEADMARNHRKLIQTALDGVTPPLPFNQIQFADLEGWQGEADHAGWRSVRRSLEQLCGPRGDPDAAERSPRSVMPDTPPRRARPKPAPVPPPAPASASKWPLFAGIGVAVIVLLGVGIFMLGQRSNAPVPQRVAVAPTSAPVLPSAAATVTAVSVDAGLPVDEDGVPIAPNPADMTIPDSSTRLITPAEIAGMGPSTLKVARNEIFARKGRRFRDPWLQDWFSRYAWYKPRFDEVPLNDIETRNVALLRQAEARFGG